MKGRDGQIRGATVRMTSNDGQGIVLSRPIQLLYPLEVRSHDPTPEAARSVDNPVDVSEVEVHAPTDDKPAEQVTGNTSRRP